MANVVGRRRRELSLLQAISKWSYREKRNFLRELGNPPSLANLSESFWRRHTHDLASVVGVHIEGVFLEQAERLVGSIPIGVDWALVNEQAANWASRYTFELVNGIEKTTRRGLQLSIDKYYRLGQTRGQLEQSISRLFPRHRVEAIAVTEISRSAVWGEWSVVGELISQGSRLTGTWATSNDELVCPICGPLNENPQSGTDQLGQPYWVHPGSGATYGLDPAHVRCRCWRNWVLLN